MFQEFPKCLYLDGDVAKAFVIVADEAEEELKAAEGYESAKSPEEIEAVDDIEDLKKKATEAGITVDARWGVKRLKAELAKVQ